MQPGRVLREFFTKNEKNVVLRTPRLEDLNGLLALINSLVEEKAEIAISKKVTYEEEAKWLPDMLAKLKRDDLFFVVTESGGKIVASADIEFFSEDEKSVGMLGMVVKRGFRDLGIGTEILKTLLEQAKSMKLKVLMLHVFSTNKPAVHIYQRAGFVQTCLCSKKYYRMGEYVDGLTMARIIE